ncbi:MAG: dihydropteroate synthase [Spirochaetaceae bacterium]|nr:dihydropteroate synthase [Spirochaetaceae bacterium]
MRYDVRRNLRVSPLDGRRPCPKEPQPLAADISIDALDQTQQRIVAASLRALSASVRVSGGTVQATVAGPVVPTLAADWQKHDATRALGRELAASWEPLPGAIAIAGIALDYARRALVMGVINATPDSFYPASRRQGPAAVAEAALRMREQGADLVDLGGESTRPGAGAVSAAEEIHRVVPAVAAVVSAGGPPVSIDTSKAAVAEAALDAGAVMVNDVNGLRDPDLRCLAAERGVPVVISHMRGTPRTMQRNVTYGDTVAEVVRELKQRINDALDDGVDRGQVIVDPGIGFGKRVGDNLRLLHGTPALRSLGPVLVGVSRKSFIGTVLEAPVEDRLAGTTIANTVALLRGADMIRVHDVPAALQAVRFAAAVRAAERG